MTVLRTRLSSALLTASLAAATAVALAIPAEALPAAEAPAGPALAAAPRLTDVTARAADLRSRVDKLAIAALVAGEDYADSQAQLDAVMIRHLLAQRQSRAARASSAEDTAIADNRMRAIYMTGGKAGLISNVLDARDLGDLTARLRTMNDLVGTDRDRVSAGAQATGQATASEAQLRRLSTQKLALQKESAAAAERVRVALSTSRQLLAAADATVQRLADQQRRAAAAAAAQAFAAQLSAARAGAALVDLGPGVPPSALGVAAVAAAHTRLGSPYVWGATGPDTFDCSGLTGWAYRKAGLGLPRTSRQQWYAGPHVGLAQLAPGDLLFWGTDPPSIHHVAIYLGGGMMIAAPQTGDVVKIQAVYSNGYLGAVRPRA